MRAVIYARVSTDGQERDGTSLESQEAACQAFAEAAGWQVVAVVRDTASGYTLDRPGMDRVRHLLRRGEVNVVLAHAVDRLARNQNHIGVLVSEVEQADARLECVTEKFEDTPEGRFILAAQAFIAEVERAKIAERTTRGKTTRAQSGKLPQATGRGIYGYRYDPASGRHERDPLQATVVERIFQRFSETRSFSSVSQELNAAGIPSFSGGRWYPLTVRSILTNETYTGRTIFRRTKRTTTRNPATGKRRSRVVERPAEDWIEVEGATPRIISQQLWERVQTIIHDPERLRRRPEGRFYALSTRTRCGLCDSSMIGQTLTVKGRAYRYYRCRHVYDKNTGRDCSARYVRADDFEAAIWREVTRVLTNPAVVLEELQRERAADTDPNEVAGLEQELKAVVEREKRLVRLYSYGEVDEDIIRDEVAGLRRQRAALEDRLRAVRSPAPAVGKGVSPDLLEQACALVAAWLERAGDEERVLALEALQVAVTTTSNSATLTGVLPTVPPEFITDEESCRCLFNGDKPAAIEQVFRCPLRTTHAVPTCASRCSRRAAFQQYTFPCSRFS